MTANAVDAFCSRVLCCADCHDTVFEQSEDILCSKSAHVDDLDAFFRRHRLLEASWHVQVECLRFRADRTDAKRCEAATKGCPKDIAR